MNQSPNGRILLLMTVLVLTSCDEARKFIDPTGKAYGKPADSTPPSKEAAATPTATESTPSEPPAEPASPPPARTATWTNRETTPLAAASALAQARNMLMTTPRGWVEFSNGRAFSQGRQLTLWDPSETPWGLGIADLNQDGAEDAVLAVRSTSSRDTSWLLAVLVDREGKLQCIQTVALQDMDGVRSLEATQGGILIAPLSGAPRLYGWVGGELIGNP